MVYIKQNPIKNMEWLDSYYKELEQEKRIKRREFEDSMLLEMRSKHLEEKKQELETLKKRVEFLEKEIQSYGTKNDKNTNKKATRTHS